MKTLSRIANAYPLDSVKHNMKTLSRIAKSYPLDYTKHKMKTLSRTSFSRCERLARLVLEICPKMHLALEAGRQQAVDTLVDVADGILVGEVNEE